jgi:hypothetical protein
MTGQAFRKLALSMPDASEEPHFERTSFRIGKKIFATMTADGGEAMVRVPSRDRVRSLLKEHPSVFFSHGYWTARSGALGVKLASADPSMMKDLITDSWRTIAPKKRR